MHYYRNHNYVLKADSKSAGLAEWITLARKAVLTKRATPATKKEASKSRPSLIAVLSLRHTDLLRFPQDLRMRKHRENEYELRSRGAKQQSQPSIRASEEQDEGRNEYEFLDRSQSPPKLVEESGAQDREEYVQQRRRRSRPLIEENNKEDNDDHQHSQKRSRIE
jgi:hypothetical protein